LEKWYEKVSKSEEEVQKARNESRALRMKLQLVLVNVFLEGDGDCETAKSDRRTQKGTL